MVIAILTLLSALSISGVAIFYSVIGLATIFPGAFVPVVIMGGVLEVGKLITASWLYRNWKFTPFMLKTYLTTAVIILSLITSMGIFGFLSKAHLEQNLASDTLIQRIQILEDKIDSEKMSIERQTLIINRAEKAISRDTGTASGDIEVQQSIIKDANEKLKTLLTVETNTVKDLNARMRVLDKDVSDVLTSNKSFFNEEKAAADLKASQKEERELISIKIAEAQDRIAELKADHKKEIAKAQEIIANMRSGSQDNKGQFTREIENAEKKIFDSQGKIDLYIVEKQPLEKEMLTLEAEIGPVKYIAALAVDWGITDQVETSKAVRWVILLLIVVFDPLAVLLLIAANQSLMRRFPPEPPKPQEIVDLEKPDEEGIDLKWNETMVKQTNEKIEKANAQLKDWKEKLESFNAKVPQPEDRPIEIIQEQEQVPHIELKGADNMQDGFDPAEVEGFEEFNKKYEEPEEEKLERFKQREREEQEALEEVARKAKEEDLEEKSIAEEIEEAMEPERIRPDFTEVLEPEVAVEEKKVKEGTVGMIGQRLVDPKSGKVIKPPKPQEPELPTPAEMTDEERKQMLDKAHNLHGKYEDISAEDLKKERDEANKAQFLADVSLTEEEAKNHPPITQSRKLFFQDHIDDILRGDTTFETLPPEIRKTVALLMDDNYEDPQIITKGSALKEQNKGIESTSAEGLKEKFMIDPKTEDRDMTDAELDALLEGFESENEIKGPKKTVIKGGKRIFVKDDRPVKQYVQNEEQTEDTKWQKIKELDIPEPEKNEIILPEIKSEEAPKEMEADVLVVENVIPEPKFTNHKNRLTSDEEYRQRIEDRINNLITKLENKEIKLNDLTEEDQKVIMDILNQNG